MEKTKLLVGCIGRLSSKSIHTRFFYVDTLSGETKNVTLELCMAIDVFNKEAKKVRETGGYSLVIPYDYKDGVAVYSFGCGLSHYLQDNVLQDIVDTFDGTLTFPLADCRISMYTPDDVDNILNCKSIFDPHIVEALQHRFVQKPVLTLKHNELGSLNEIADALWKEVIAENERNGASDLTLVMESTVYGIREIIELNNIQ